MDSEYAKQFFVQPVTIVRLCSILFSIIVFGCLSSKGYSYTDCVFNSNADACNYGVAIGVLTFLIQVGLCAADFYRNSRAASNVGQKRAIVCADLVLSAFWAFLWFVGFCFLVNQWNRTSDALQKHLTQSYRDEARTVIAFSFFSIFSHAYNAFMAMRVWRAGFELFASADDVLHGVGGNGSDQQGFASADDQPGVLDAAGGGGATGAYQPYQQQPPMDY